jgi:hypothetical protein
MKLLKCVWCCKDTETIPCQNCGKSDTVCDPYVEHQPYWSRYTIHLVECSICGRTTTYDKQTNHPCPPKSLDTSSKPISKTY